VAERSSCLPNTSATVDFGNDWINLITLNEKARVLARNSLASMFASNVNEMELSGNKILQPKSPNHSITKSQI
jgi:hypothetical protein